ncbi:MAG: bifunctional pyr operon transcriptional regulator/uracil phosphoribosyltransferase PyrR [Desulfarculales bacterium]|jgi:pyrimidine operon attenuation protein/uracil phosphoribosyltransferase|nr:bifunctional pyr operon transcriptional regulator/uracil phosphoribosyltransferase PyrR [Desulfarculales bacterium]
MSDSQIIFGQEEIEAMLKDMAGRICRGGEGAPCLVGIRTGGAYLSHRLAMIINPGPGGPVRQGAVDINLYRDDWSLRHIKPRLGGTEIDFDLRDQRIILVDDVLYTGRTVRAALDAILDLGRPRRIELAALIDRGGRELPIAPDYVGAALDARPGQRVDVLLRESGHGRDEVRLLF